MKIKNSVIAFCLVVVSCILVIAAAGGCGSSRGSSDNGSHDTTLDIFDSSLPSGVISFEVSPVSIGSYIEIMPLGNLNPPDHTLPTDHIYFRHDDTTETIPVYAPIGGKILDIYPFGNGSHDHRLIIGVKSTYSYYLIHLVASSSLEVGDTISTGQQVGVASNNAAAVDLGVLCKDFPQPFINSDHYVNTNIYSGAPLKYFAEPLKSQLYDTVRGLGEDKDGKFCYDLSGKLVGGWFLSGTTSREITGGVEVGTKEVAFVYDNYDPNQIMISVGGTVLSKGVYYVQNGATDPANVTASSGKITYKLFTGSSEVDRTGLIIVEMMSDATAKVEGFADTTSDTADFTSAAKIFER